MEQRRRLIVGGSVAALALALVTGCSAIDEEGGVPMFQVNGLWPQPLEYPSILGPISGVEVAPDGNILIVTTDEGFSAINEINSVTGTGDCCTPTQAVLEYAPDGSLVAEWGGEDQGYPWLASPHGIGVDPEGNVWIGGGVAQSGGGFGGGAVETSIDTHILKFSRDGQHLMTIGDVEGDVGSQSTTSFGGANGFSFDADANEVYVADGYANRRVAVLDISTGEFLRSWGAYGNPPDDSELEPYDPAAPPAQQFREVTCAEISDDELVYVCDRGNNRIQVFETDGTFVTEATIMPQTLGDGSVWDIAFSPDQDFLYVADGMNERVHILDRESLEHLTSFGSGGRYPGHFLEVAGIDVDDQGNIYTAEDGQGRRLQLFEFQGMGEPGMDQGPLYPGDAMGLGESGEM